ncbi:MAG: hypothetical protein VZR73_14785 [Acutalibacteraceae bacterium]|nr:hypothetical protein [Acutalibacteraceae bacterium]
MFLLWCRQPTVQVQRQRSRKSINAHIESADTADTGNISLLGGLIQADNLLSALSAVYPTEKHTAIYGPMRNLDMNTWNTWVTYIGQYGAYGIELSQQGKVTSQEELNKKSEKYIYGCQVVSGRQAHEQLLISEGGMAGGYVGYMTTGVISDGQSYDMKQIRAMRSTGGYAGKMQSGGAAEFGNANILGLGLNLSSPVKAVQVFVTTIRSGTVH